MGVTHCSVEEEAIYSKILEIKLLMDYLEAFSHKIDLRLVDKEQFHFLLE